MLILMQDGKKQKLLEKMHFGVMIFGEKNSHSKNILFFKLGWGIVDFMKRW